jgi:glycerol-3-phosphate acyltransferase PlsY
VSALILKLILSYLLGGIVGSLALGRLRGVDIRALGSGNAGATNAMRTQGKGFAALVAMIDIGKGMLAAAVIAPTTLVGADALSPGATALACGIAAALGHCFPAWHGFRGGKGAGTLFGAIVIVFPWIALAMLIVWLLVLVTTGYVGLSTLLAGAAFPVAILMTPAARDTAIIVLAIGAALLLAWMHRGNISRLARGTEYRFRRVRLFARRR